MPILLKDKNGFMVKNVIHYNQRSEKAVVITDTKNYNPEPYVFGRYTKVVDLPGARLIKDRVEYEGHIPYSGQVFLV